jgi:hypothetical protein
MHIRNGDRTLAHGVRGRRAVKESMAALVRVTLGLGVGRPVLELPAWSEEQPSVEVSQ